MMDAFESLHPRIGVTRAADALCLNRAGIYRARAARHQSAPPRPRSPVRSPLALSDTERGELIEILNSERFVDRAPAAIYATLLDEGRYHGSVRTMYRLLASLEQTGERRRQRVHPAYEKPELLATEPNRVWSWDITKLKGPVKWSVFHLYVILGFVPFSLTPS